VGEQGVVPAGALQEMGDGVEGRVGRLIELVAPHAELVENVAEGAGAAGDELAFLGGLGEVGADGCGVLFGERSSGAVEVGAGGVWRVGLEAEADAPIVRGDAGDVVAHGVDGARLGRPDAEVLDEGDAGERAVAEFVERFGASDAGDVAQCGDAPGERAADTVPRGGADGVGVGVASFLDAPDPPAEAGFGVERHRAEVGEVEVGVGVDEGGHDHGVGHGGLGGVAGGGVAAELGDGPDCKDLPSRGGR